MVQYNVQYKVKI